MIFRKKYPYVHEGTFAPILIKDSCFYRTPAFQNTSKTHIDIRFDKEVKTIIDFGLSLHS